MSNLNLPRCNLSPLLLVLVEVGAAGWDGLCQAPVYQIQVPSRITAQQGLCVLLPCHFTANFESSGVPYKYWFLRNDDRDTSLAVATTDPGRALREPGGRIRLVGDAPDDCSLHISDVRAGDRDHYYFRFVKGDFKYSYMVTHNLVGAGPSRERGAAGPGRALANVSCAATQAHGQSQAALPVVPAGIGDCGGWSWDPVLPLAKSSGLFVFT
uniref:Immunoglobulin V-set domain-containing protein n=1 Tax=Gopherus agassizii TaxID=38772 RepID=A0A452HWR3_9SAUR